MASVDIAVRQAVLTIRMDRPERGNGIDAELLDGLASGLDEAERREQVRAVVLAGSDGVFSTGMDFDRSQATGGGSFEAGARRYIDLLSRLESSPFVTVASVDGRAIGGGVGLAAACDLVWATERSRFSLPELLWGLLPYSVFPYVRRRVGAQGARALTLSTLPWTAEHAWRRGLVDDMPEPPEAQLRRLAGRVGRLDRDSIAEAKAYARRFDAVGPADRDYAVRAFAERMDSETVRGRLAAFRDLGAVPERGR
ncbi:enoyl-CoA hydratase/isomerase family protein [Glycomyces halotolerans]